MLYIYIYVIYIYVIYIYNIYKVQSRLETTIHLQLKLAMKIIVWMVGSGKPRTAQPFSHVWRQELPGPWFDAIGPARAAVKIPPEDLRCQVLPINPQ